MNDNRYTGLPLGDCKCGRCESARRDQAAIADGAARDRKATELDSRLLDAANALATERAELEADCAAYRAQRDDAQKEAETLKGRIASLDATIGIMTEHLGAAKADCDLAYKQAEDANKDLFSKLEVIRSQRATIGEREENIERLQAETAAQAKSAATLMQRVENAEAQLRLSNVDAGPRAVLDGNPGLIAQPGDCVRIGSDVTGICAIVETSGKRYLSFIEGSPQVPTSALLGAVRWGK